MIKYRGFPSRMPGTDYQFTIRRENPRGATKLIRRERFKDRKRADIEADAAFLSCLIEYFGTEVFHRGSLDAGRISWFFGREIIPVSYPFDPNSYESLLRLNFKLIRKNYPELLTVFS